MKAILVVDIHKEIPSEIKSAFDCTNCPMHYENQDFKMHCFVDDYITNIKGKCPLKPLPRKEKGRNWHTSIAKENTYVCGWNDCIDEILGEEE